MDRQLTITVMPDRAIIPEWIETDGTLSGTAAGIQKNIHDRYTHDPHSWLFYLGFHEQDSELSLSLNYFISLSALFVRKISRIPDLETLRHLAAPEISDTELDGMMEGIPMMTGADYIDKTLLHDVWSGFGDSFSGIVREYDGSMASFFASLNPSIHLAGRVFFHLVENKKGNLPFAFMATYSSGMGSNGKPKHLPLKHALTEYDNHQDTLLKLLSTVYAAAEQSDLVKEMIDTGELFHPLSWGAEEAFCFLKEIAVYEDAGILCRIPDWWKKKSPGASVRVNLGDSKPARVGLDALVDFKAHILLGDMEITAEEARRMLEESEGLAFIKNKWVPVDHEKLKQAIALCEASKALESEGLTLREALRLQLNPEKLFGLPEGGKELSVTHGMWLESLIGRLKNLGELPHIDPGKGFRADLRPYQKQGLNWLHLLDTLNFGACLADDMGLGKTVQILAFLSILKSRKSLNASLLIVPASLISNWIDEIDRFFPALCFRVVHPGFTPPAKSGKSRNGDLQLNKSELDAVDLIITTYALIQRYEWLHDYEWTYAILDEAQAIKNPGTKQTRAVKKLKARNRIIMTGTPVENRLSDVWSLFDFLNAGLLGNKAEFARFSKSLTKNTEGYGRLRKLVSPYILRRLKTDKTVISDLPDKVEMKSFASLSKKQIVLYQKAVEDLTRAIDKTDGVQRKGIVLSSLMKFKQLCNHPDQIAGSGDFSEQDSGKFIRLREICETVYEKRERLLVFTQFKEMTEPLRSFLETIFHRPGLVLHGSVPVGKRKEIIETFQKDVYCPFMVLSLKAGGVGLNLTKANHVVHFDRWWNPAVENQATDRAFRIGQKKNVVVHKFITRGTIEEKIDMMLKDKQDLSDQVIAQSGETLITELNNHDLINLFRLRL
ncbi:MAG: DEAD/DEAH box helicase [Proteobacteria bacterium]|nr:DEAD/DEAH box helicase [Pseudomonadota bacterium]